MLKPEWLQAYIHMCDMVKNADNGILDMDSSYEESFSVSDAMIGEEGSMPMLFIFTKKPVLMLRATWDDNIKYIDYTGCYFENDGITVGGFIDMIKKGQDEKKEERISKAFNSIANVGCSGKAVHNMVMEEMCSWD